MKYTLEYHILRIVRHMFNGTSLFTALIFIKYLFKVLVLEQKIDNMETFAILLTLCVSLLFASFSYLTKELLREYKLNN